MSLNKTTRVAGIDVLRGLAIFFVLMNHVNMRLLHAKVPYTAGLPDPDLLIRTSGEMRISNYLLWQIAYAEIFVTERFWPDFRGIHLLEAIAAYQRRERRYGGLGEAEREDQTSEDIKEEARTAAG